MKKIIFSLAATALGFGASAQNAMDAYSISQGDLRGTARFMSMAGAFGALGGDLSTLTQNPAGLGVYRSSEIGATLDFDFQSVSTQGFNKNSMTKVFCNNFGYVGTVNLQGDLMKTFSWGATFNRRASFNRDYHGSFASMPTSLTNYIAGQVSPLGVTPGELSEFGSTNPYDPHGSYWPYWLGVLGYNTGLINPTAGTSYIGLAGNNSAVDGYFSVSERGYLDEYSINFGGNLADIVYWGIGVGITDLSFTQWSTYSEDVTNANVPVAGSRDPQFTGRAYTEGGTASYFLDNYKHITGSGFNIKLGVIVKPIEEFRLGVAVHTPTWTNLNLTTDASVDFEYSSGYTGFFGNGYDELDYPSYLEYSMRTPWKFMLSAAGVIGGRFILSADYERDAYDAMSFSNTGGYNTDFSYQNEDIKYYYKAANSFRLGAEFRVTPQLSVRAGYSYRGDNVKNDVFDPQWQANEGIYTSGAYDQDTNPAFTFNKTTQYATCGIGYRFGRFYIDAAYAYRMRKSVYQPFTSWNDNNSLKSIPQANISQTDNNLVLSIGYKF